MSPPLRLFIVAGEPSGDIMAAALVGALRDLAPGGVELRGVGGERLEAAGLRSLFPMEELAVMGLAEVLPRLPGLRRRLSATAAAVAAWQPDAVVTVDSPGFNLRLLAGLRGLPSRRIHYVAPQAWAWRPGRAAALPALLDRLLVVLPFEPAFFARYGVETLFVGHPAIERVPMHGDRRGFVARHGLGDAGPVLLLLPGSRRQELARHLPVLGRATAELRRRFPRLRAVLPTLPHLLAMVEAEIGDWPLRPVVIEGEAERMAAFAAADLALTASGTVTLELALAGVPMIVAHRLHPVTGLVARRLIDVPNVTLANLVLGRQVVPELLQSACRADRLVEAADSLLRDDRAIAAQRAALAEIRGRLAAGSETPSRCAARAVLETVGPPAQPRSAIGTKARFGSPV